MIEDSVILAVASAPGSSPRAIIRASGRETFNLLASQVDLTTLDLQAPAIIRSRLRFRDPNLEIPTLMLTFPAPRSYTGENAAELQLPGNPALLQRVIDVLINSGRARNIAVRRANPGEFTARAFLNGRLSLSQAEGVAATIAAQSDAELAAARLLAAGRLARVVTDLSDRLASALALVEAGIDFTDQEDVVAITPRDLHHRLMALAAEIHSLLKHSIGLEQLQAIPWVVLTGPPNAGKSTLFNALLGRERAVVSPIAGTTRDVLAEPMTIPIASASGGASVGRGEIMLVDLAGLDESCSLLNQQVQSAARAAVERAELILHCIPADDEKPASLASSLSPNMLLVRTKMDKSSSPCAPGEDGSEGSLFSPLDACSVSVSATTRAGLPRLRQIIARRLASRAVSLAADTLALRPRHEAALRECRENLRSALSLIHPQHSRLHAPELIAATMRAALDALGAIHGRISPDDILARIFASFCIGK